MPEDPTAPFRLLQFAPAFAAHPMNGAELRSYHLARGLARSMEVTHLGFSSTGAASIPRADGIQFISVPRERSYRRVDLARGAMGPVPFPVLNYTRANMKTALEQTLASTRFAFVQLESIHLAGYMPILRRHVNKPRFIVCDWHNIESALLAQSTEGRGGWVGKLYIRRQAKLLETFERRFLNQCDAHIAVSEADRDVLLAYGANVPVFTIPNGVDVQYFSGLNSGASPSGMKRHRVLFVGSMDYYANIDGVKQFAAETWPDIRRHLPETAFTIVGRNPPPDVRALAAQPGIEVTGSVPDVRPYYREAFVVVVPLRAGGGTRLKILEAMAAGLPVISTKVGAEGLAVAPGRHYFEANTPADMCARVLEAARGESSVAHVAAAGHELAKQLYDWSSLAGSLTAQIMALASSSLGRPEAARQTR